MLKIKYCKLKVIPLSWVCCIPVGSRHVASYFGYERADVDSTASLRWLPLIGRKSVESFIPVTRIQLINSITRTMSKKYKPSGVSAFGDFGKRLDVLLQIHNKLRLKELKSLYNPISPDRDTVQMKYFSVEQLKTREEQLLDQISKLLFEAGFYELPDNIIRKALYEFNEKEKIDYYIDTDHFDVLRFWVIGLDLAPVDGRSLYNKAKQYRNKTTKHMDPQEHHYYDNYFVKNEKIDKAKDKLSKKKKENVRRIERYKRVIVSFRRKTDEKLHLKAFKDIPCDNLEFLLPDGKLKMRGLDRVRIASLAALLMTFYGAGIITSYKLQTNVIISVTLFFIFLRSWNLSRILKNKVLMNILKTLYFKTIGNNHALLTLITDRSEDEMYKASLLICACLWDQDITKDLLTTTDLNLKIEEWLKENYKISLKFDSSTATKLLEDLDIIHSVHSARGKGFKLNLKDCGIPASYERNFEVLDDDLLQTSVNTNQQITWDGENFEWK